MTQLKKNPRRWMEAAAIRAVKTMAQTFLAMTAGAVVFEDVKSWPYIGSAVLLAGVFSLATSLAGLPEVDE